jgi:hypothetical protein
MKTHELFFEAQGVIGRHWREGQPSERAQALGFARDVLFFISDTGQRYRFEDYREAPRLEARENPSGESTSLEEVTRGAVALFGGLLEAAEPREWELIRAILDALEFVVATGQPGALEAYLHHLHSGEPPLVVAAFDTREEAEHWLATHPSPPAFAQVLVGNRYHSVFHDRDTNVRRLLEDNAMEYHLAELARAEPPVPVASLDTLEEADAWWKARPAPAHRRWVSAAGELYLAVDHATVGRRVLYPRSMGLGPPRSSRHR